MLTSDSALDAASALCDEISQQPKRCITNMKSLVNQYACGDFDEARRQETILFRSLWAEDDHIKAIKSWNTLANKESE
jgi:hypothetical protein